MIDLGKWNTLEVVRIEDRGVYLDGHESGEILLPTLEGGEGKQLGDWLQVFIYKDSEDRLIATMREPKIIVGEYAKLHVKEVNRVGAFLDWGLSKDLMLPFGEQKRRVSQGMDVVVRAYVDEETGRIAATTRLGRFLGKSKRRFLEDEQVEVLVVRRSTPGYNVIVEGVQWGMIYHDQIFQPISVGDRLTGYVHMLREDDKLDIVLQKAGNAKVETLAEQILDKLRSGNGFLELSDKSDALEIRAMFGVSKKTYKKALGQLYKDRLISFADGGVKLING